MCERLISIVLTVWITATLCPAQVIHVRFWTLHNFTRVVIETSAPFEYHSDRLYNPDRLIFELRGAGLIEPDRQTNIDDKLLKRVHLVQMEPGVTQVTLELAADVSFSATRASKPDQLIVELRSKSRVLPHGRPASLLPPPVPEDPAPLREDQSVGAKATLAGERTLTRALGLKVGRIVVDPGHGGRDVGCVGTSGLQEKEVALDIARKLGTLIEKRLGIDLIYTRSDDSSVALEDRARIASKKRADLFISIHANSSPEPAVSGVESYYASFAANRAAFDLAARENTGSEKSIHDLAALIGKITDHEKATESREFAFAVQRALQKVQPDGNRSTAQAVRTAPLVVLIGAEMPSILVEVGYLSNTREESLMKTPGHRERLAEALYDGLSQYMETLGQFTNTEPSKAPPVPTQTAELNRHTLVVEALPIRQIGIGICVIVSWVLSFRLLRRLWY